MAETKLNHDAVTQLLFEQIVSGIKAINVANETLLAEEEAGAGLREIDTALKALVKDGVNEDGKVTDTENEKVIKAYLAAQKANKAYKDAVTAARNAYRTDVLKEEAKEVSENDVDKDAVKEQRSIVMQSVDLIKSYAGANGKKDIVTWAETLEIPQVGRKGTSVVGQKKPRAYVSVNGTRHDSFGEAAKAAVTILSTDDNKVNVSSGDLVSAWTENGEANEFEYQGLKVKVDLKQKAA